MCDAAMDATYCLRVIVNKEKTQVLFAEADSDLLSILLSFLGLPLGRIAKVLEKHYGDEAPTFGSITFLYKGLANLDDDYFSSGVAKPMLLDPPSLFDPIFSKLKVDVFKHSSKYFVCCCNETALCFTRKCICMYYGGAAKCSCGLLMTKEAVVKYSLCAQVPFTKKNESVLISDDLKLFSPNPAGFLKTLINNFGVAVADGAELRNISLGTNEIMDLLKCCLLSKTPLTDFVLNKGHISISSATKPSPEIFLHQIESEKIINLKVMVHKFSNKVLFAQADEDFIELLFSFLHIPIGGVEYLLDNKTCLNNLDNLYKSISDGSLEKYFVYLDTKRLLNPNIPYSSKSKSTFLPFNYESAPSLWYGWNRSYNGVERLLIAHHNVYKSKFTFKSTIGEHNYVKEATTYLVTDDLTVIPFHISSVFSILNRLNIPMSDVNELEVHIGLQEALNILKASLTSNSALNSGLFNRLMKKPA